jgi:uncharacterized protein YprB with RNaseH-like and TPR domain
MIHGMYQLNELIKMEFPKVDFLFNGLGQLDFKDIVFLDTETTGLGTGPGTVAFLIGVGYFLDGSFFVQQYFMRDYDEELPMIEDIKNLINDKKALVTFNGRAFDWNLIESRYIFNRIRDYNKNIVHVDLLYPSRLVWKKILKSCRLAVLEEKILKVYRKDDIPGMLIPGIYFKYLQTRDASEIKKVLMHNELDILSMVTLFTRICKIFSDPIVESFDWNEIFYIAAAYSRYEYKATAIEFFKHCCLSKNIIVRIESYKKLANIFRKDKNYKNAIICLEQALKYSNEPEISVLIDLSKHYEHRIKDYNKALDVIKTAIDTSLKLEVTRKLYLEELKYRHDRIIRKIELNSYFYKNK